MNLCYYFSDEYEENALWLIANVSEEYILTVLIEELGEMQKECCKMLRYMYEIEEKALSPVGCEELKNKKFNAFNRSQQELADVLNMSILSGIYANRDFMEEKIKRFVDRMKKLGYN